MKCSIQIYQKTNNVLSIFLPPLLAAGMLVYVFCEGVSRYERKIASYDSYGIGLYKILFLIASVSCILFLSYSIYVSYKKNFMLFYWTNMKKKEIILYEFLNQQGYFYTYGIVQYLFGRKIIFAHKYLLIPVVMLYFVTLFLTVNIFFEKGIHRTGSFSSKNVWKQKHKAQYQQKEIVLSSIGRNLKYRCLSLERMGSQLLVIAIGIGSFFMTLSANELLVLYLFLNVISVSTEKRYWKKKNRTIKFCLQAGVPLHSYLRVEFIGGACFHMALLCVISFLKLPVEMWILCISLLAFVTIYWMLLMLLIQVYLERVPDVVKFLLEISGAVFMLIPIVNICLMLIFWRIVKCLK